MIKVGIVGYGNLGKGVESALSHRDDMELVGVFTRRDPSSLKTMSDVNVYHYDELMNKNGFYAELYNSQFEL